jgi:hypothetical protein
MYVLPWSLHGVALDMPQYTADGQHYHPPAPLPALDIKTTEWALGWGLTNKCQHTNSRST